MLFLALFGIAFAVCSTDDGVSRPEVSSRLGNPYRVADPEDAGGSAMDLHRTAELVRLGGRAWMRHRYLTLAQEREPLAERQTEIDQMDTRYGRVVLDGHPRWRPVLCVGKLPFAPEEVLAIRYALYIARNTGSFDGMLPVGEYQFGDQMFTVTGGEALSIKIKKARKLARARQRSG